MQRSELNAATIRDLPITWHSTTPKHFECQPGCVCCCIATLFFPSEAERYPAEIKNGLTWREGFIRAQRRPPGVCAFFDEHIPWHCRIPTQRPLRCRLYPYLPLVTEKGIVILADPLCTVSFPETDFPQWYRCYGLGCGANVQSAVAQMSREFLRKVAEEYPLLLNSLIVADVERCLNPKEIEKNLRPVYRKWDRENVIRAMQTKMDPG